MAQKNRFLMFILDKTILKLFVVTKILKKAVVYGISGLFCVVIGGYFVMAMIVKKDTSNDVQYIANIKNGSQDLPISRINNGDLYNNWCIKDSNGKISSDDFYLDKLTNAQKSMIFQFIPNGNPLDLFEMKQRAKRRSYDTNPLSDISNVGYDYYTPKSEPVLATAAGVVEFIRDSNQKYGYKNLVRIAHVQGFSTIYMNLDKVKVKKGDFVSKGDVLGFSVASPGKNHISLYYEVRFLNKGIDTYLFVNWYKQSFSSIFELNQSSDIDIKSLIWALNDIVWLNEEYDMLKYSEWFKIAAQAENEESALVGARFNNINSGFMKDDEYNMTIIPQNVFNDYCRLIHDDRLVNNADYSIIDKFYATSVAAAQKHFIMNFIPNGRPLQIALHLSAPYGKRHHPILHIYRMHAGVDIIAPMNTPVYATADGVVDLAKNVDNGGYGKLVKITHSFGFHTNYAHLNEVKVKRGEFVKKGQLIALTGSTGTSTGPHLHYEVRFLGQPIDPMNFISWDMQNFNLIFDKERRISWHSLLELINNLMEMRQMSQQLSHPILSLRVK